jgi:hypothetical protein
MTSTAAAFLDLKTRLDALVRDAGGIGVLYVVGVLDFYLHRRLCGRLTDLIDAVRRALMRRALELLGTLKPKRIVAARDAVRPRVRTLLDDRPKLVVAPAPVALEPYPGFGPRVRSFDGPQRETLIPERIPFCGRIALMPIERKVFDDEARRHHGVRQPFYWIPETICSKGLARRLEALMRLLENPERYARRLARRLRDDAGRDRPPPVLLRDAALYEKRAALSAEARPLVRAATQIAPPRGPLKPP